jgi:16S rRNA processing protein RimM
MKIDACFQLGYITGTRGLSGEVLALLDSDQPEYYKDVESLFVLPKGGKTLIPFFVESLQLKGAKASIKFEEVNSKDQARQVVGGGLYLPLDQLPQLAGDSYYYHELIGWTVQDEKQGVLGAVSAVIHQSPQILLVMDYRSKEVLIPFNDHIVQGIDRNQQLVRVLLPEGLLEVYLDD